MLKSIFLEGRRPYLWIALVAILVYGQTLFFGFVNLDDTKIITENYTFFKDVRNLPQIFLRDPYLATAPATQYRPLIIASFMLDVLGGGKNPFMFHLTNIFLHAIAAGLLFALLLKLGYNRNISFLFSVLFTVHPVLTQAVAWIPGRNASQLAIFVLSSFLCFLNWLDTRKWGYYCGGLAL